MAANGPSPLASPFEKALYYVSGWALAGENAFLTLASWMMGVNLTGD